MTMVVVVVMHTLHPSLPTPQRDRNISSSSLALSFLICLQNFPYKLILIEVKSLIETSYEVINPMGFCYVQKDVSILMFFQAKLCRIDTFFFDFFGGELKGVNE
ncbi:Uncharacterized protein TCM_021306 [Theobroma cacao]|uniref:Uncharacterized protein n=1 Tax=Theobroma cacao TaxID=3641 RepID=A0A061EP80_THECC|nr:Uncharacterized protein TCM_021306 [Theobroma cacao]